MSHPKNVIAGGTAGLSEVLEVVARAWQRFRPLQRGYRAEGGADPAVAVLDEALDILGEPPHSVTLATREAAGFGELLRARWLQRQGRYAEAGSAANAAVSLWNEDLVAQRLALACEERRDGIRSSVDDWLASRSCSRPWTTAETFESGRVNFCCSGWMPRPIGRLNSRPWKEIWNSRDAREVRQSVGTGEFAYCSRVFCPHIATRSLPPRRAEAQPAAAGGFVAEPPQRLLLSHDRSCNLSCPSCRTKVIVASAERGVALDRLLDETLAPLISTARSVKLTGSGDPIASRHFRRLLTRMREAAFSGVELELQTNGVLLTPEVWEALDLDNRVGTLWVSLDAATAETYSVVRRGGDWQQLMANLAFFAEKRRTGRLAHIRLDFVVQATNFRELPAFVEIARAAAADHISLQRIRNWGTFDADEFQWHDIASGQHPDHEALLETLADPRLEDRRILWGNMGPLRDAAEARAKIRPRPPIARSGGALIVHEGRCGSTLLAGMLAHSERLRVEGEIFAPKRFAQGTADARAMLLRRHHAALPFHLVFEVKTWEIGRIGFDWDGFLELVRSTGTAKVIFIRRRNVLRRIVSGDLAMRDGHFHSRIEVPAPPSLAPLDLDPNTLVQRIEWVLEHRRHAEQALAPWEPLMLEFETDLEVDPLVGYRRGCRHLGVEPNSNAVPPFARSPRYRLADMLARPEEIGAALAGGPHAWMLDG